MPANEFFLLEAVNLFLDKDRPDEHKALSLDTVTLPNIEYDTVEHKGGGAILTRNFNMGILKPLEITFKLAGMDRQSYGLIAAGASRRLITTWYGALRSHATGKTIKAVATARGCFNKLTGDGFKRGEAFGHDTSFGDIDQYELVVAGVTWLKIDADTQTIVVDSQDLTVDFRAALGLG
jgi:P2 family phage contractile tail tube protein